MAAAEKAAGVKPFRPTGAARAAFSPEPFLRPVASAGAEGCGGSGGGGGEGKAGGGRGAHGRAWRAGGPPKQVWRGARLPARPAAPCHSLPHTSPQRLAAAGLCTAP
jgi:hypothetical protein